MVAMRAVVQGLEFQGHSVVISLRIGPQLVVSRTGPLSPMQVGEHVLVSINLSQACWFDSLTGLRLEPDCQSWPDALA
jgi:hypothetical protein